MSEFNVIKGENLFLIVQPDDLNKLIISLIEAMSYEQLRQWVNQCSHFPEGLKAAFLLRDEAGLKDALCGFMIFQNAYYRRNP